jgi:hypothetical protein
MRSILVLAFAIAACGDDSAPGDGGTGMDSGSTTCTGDPSCDDGTFCNGAERCVPGASIADARGCAPADTLPCSDGVTCDEATAACLSDCEVMPDADGDGVDGAICGGTDCDDSDRNRFPGNAEICDVDNVDEDCDPRTFGFRDSDGDLSGDDRCCNTDASSVQTCGEDCDDANPGAHHRATESCDLVDNDCDDNIDEAVTSTFFLDGDGDGRGVMEMTTEACDAPEGYAPLAGDCDDADARRHPGNAEVCDAERIDEDCDGMTNEDCVCSGAESRSCAEAGFMGPCALGRQDCLGGTWGACSITPSPELCNAVDDDCDARTDETFTCVRSTARACTTGCATAGEQICNASCTYDSCRAAFEVCNYCDDNLSGSFADDRGIATFTRASNLRDSRTTFGSADALGLWNGSVLNSVGAAYFADTIVLGFGELVIDAGISAFGVGGDSQSNRGWAIVIFAESTGAGFVGVAADLGVPRGRDGYSVEWYFNGTGSDRMTVRQLSAAGADPELRSSTSISPDMPDGGFTGADQRAFLRLTPDVPGTPANEMILRIEQPAGTRIYECIGDVCGQRLSVGQRVRIGLSGANGAAADHRSLVVAGLMTTLRQTESCAP